MWSSLPQSDSSLCVVRTLQGNKQEKKTRNRNETIAISKWEDSGQDDGNGNEERSSDCILKVKPQWFAEELSESLREGSKWKLTVTLAGANERSQEEQDWEKRIVGVQF
jgi:hypothetical protein